MTRVDDALATIPNVDGIIAEALDRLRKAEGFSPEHIMKDFGAALVKLEATAFAIYKVHEKAGLRRLVDSHLKDVNEGTGSSKDGVRKVLEAAAPEIQEFEFRAGQSRKSRGGSTWEKLGPALLEVMGVKCEKPTGADARSFNQIDRIVPSVEVARNRPDQAIFLSFKRTTRERWRTLVDERRLGYLYLVTGGEDITEAKLGEMETKKIIAYVPQHVKEKSPEFRKSKAVRPFNELPKDLRRYL